MRAARSLPSSAAIVAPALVGAALLLDIVARSSVPVDAVARPVVAVGAVSIFLAVLLAWPLGWFGAAYAVTLAVIFAIGPAWVGTLLVGAALIWVGRAVLGHRGWRETLDEDRASRGLVGVAAAFLLFTIATNTLQGGFAWPSAAPPGDASVSAAAGQPDIYVILLDGYGRSDTLASFGFDNAPFENALEARGFDVARRSHSNYNKTWLTIATMLDMRHLADIDVMPPASAPDYIQQRALTRVINNARSFDLLRSRGYEIIATETAFPELAIRSADRIEAEGHLSAFEIGLLRTEADGILGRLAYGALLDDHRQRAKDQLTALPAIAAIQSARPRFVWAHIVAPHPPLAFAADSPEHCYPKCSFYTPTAKSMNLTPEQFEDGFVSQTQAINDLVIEAADGILKSSPHAVIVVMSDHGVRHVPDTHEQLANFFAARTPGHPELFPNNAAAVTVMASLLDAYLDAGVALPDPSQVFYTSNTGLVNFTQVGVP